MDIKNKSVAITGADGFIGSHVLQWLLNREANVTALIRDGGNLNEKVRVVRGDIRDRDTVQRLYYEAAPDLVLHFAAVAPVGHAYRDPLQAIAVNTMGTAILLDTHRRFAPDAPIILSSSDKAYGSLSEVAFEHTPSNCLHPYDASKHAADILTKALSSTYGIKAYITRCVNVFGPYDTHWDRLIPYVIRQALMKEEIILRSDGSPVRHYIYISDVVDAYKALISKLYPQFDRPEDRVFNIAYGVNARSVLDVLDIISEVIGRPLNYTIMDPEMHETDVLLVDGSLFHELMGWMPKTSFKHGIELTAAWVATYLGFDTGDVLR